MQIDFSTATWVAVVTWAHDEMERARKRNDGDLDAVATATIRGEILALKKLLALPEKAARAKEAESVYAHSAAWPDGQ